MLGLLEARRYTLAASVCACLLTPGPAMAAGVPSTPPDGTYAYTLEQAGQKFGASSVTVKHDAVDVSVHEVESRAALESAYVSDETVDPVSLAPTSYTVTFPINAQVVVTGHLAFGPGGSSLTVDGTSGSTDLKLQQGTTRQIVLDGSLISGFLLLPSQAKAESLSSFTLISPMATQSALAQIDTGTTPARPADVPSPDVSLAVTGSVNFVEWYDPQTMVVDEIDVPGQQVVITRTRP
jgi:hypothetical protein